MMKFFTITLAKALELVPTTAQTEFKTKVLKTLSTDSVVFGKDTRGIFAITPEYYRRAKDTGLTDEEVFNKIMIEKSVIGVDFLLNFLRQLTDPKAFYDAEIDLLESMQVEVLKRRDGRA